MKIINNEYTFTGNCNLKIILFSDIHLSNLTNLETLTNITEFVYQKKPNYICIPGDIIDDYKYIQNNTRNALFLDWFKNLANIAPVIISLGNHDFVFNENKIDFKTDFFENLKKIKNIHLLNNTHFEDEKIHAFGYTSTIDKKDLPIDIKEYMKDLKSKYSLKKNKKYNILLCHSPRNIISDEIIKTCLNNVNLVLSGHMHNGMIPPFLEKISKSNRGIISPNKKLFPKIARRNIKKRINNHEINFVISGGITKLSETAPKKLQKFNKFYKPHIETIYVKEG